MPETGFPPMGDLLPHRGRAVLLGRVLAHDAKTTTCTVDPEAGAHFRDADGAMPAAFGLECMAQAVAAHGGLLDREAGRDPRPGFFLGSRRLLFAVDRLPAGRELVVTATHLRGSRGVLAFDCAIRDGAAAGGDTPAGGETPAVGNTLMVSGVLTVYLLEGFDALERDFGSDD